MMKKDIIHAYLGYKIFAIPEKTHEHCINEDMSGRHL
jgi:hypothetical protein